MKKNKPNDIAEETVISAEAEGVAPDTPTPEAQEETAQPKPLTPDQQIAALQLTVDELTAENEKLHKTVNRLQNLADKSETYLNQLVAMKNDFESYKRRMKFNAEQSRQEGVESVGQKLIEIADTFEIAKKHLADPETLKAFDMVYQQLVATLSTFGITALDVNGQPFDHNTMNALSKLDCGPEMTDKVVEVYKKGYVMGEKILRYAEVIVGS